MLIDADCRTEVDGLLVAGEDAGGTHGANRLGGNGVAESTVFGARAGDTAVRLAEQRPRRVPAEAEVRASLARAYAPLTRSLGPWPFDLTWRLKELMWRSVGVVRDGPSLERATKELDALADEVGDIAVPGPPQVNFAWQEALDLANQVTVAKAMAHAAAWRTETRGAHARSDFPDTDARPRYLVQRAGGDGLAGAITPEVREVTFSHLRPAEPERRAGS